jgi:hypothetical protein
MKSDFDPDVGMWYECENCDYRESVSSAPTTAPAAPQGDEDTNYTVAACPTCQQPALRADHWKESAVTYGPLPSATTTSEAAIEAAEALRGVIDPFFQLNRDWKTEVAAIISKHIPDAGEVERLRAKQEWIRTKIAWRRDGIGPDVPVLQPHYDALRAERDKLRTELADARADTIAKVGEIERLQKLNDDLLHFFGATLNEKGGVSIDMKTYHAVHLCEEHQSQPWKRKDIEERCTLCLQRERDDANASAARLREQLELLDDPDGLYSEARARIERAARAGAIKEVVEKVNADSAEAYANKDIYTVSDPMRSYWVTYASALLNEAAALQSLLDKKEGEDDQHNAASQI